MNKAKLYSEPSTKVGGNVVAAVYDRRIFWACSEAGRAALPRRRFFRVDHHVSPATSFASRFCGMVVLLGLALLADVPAVMAQPTLGVMPTNNRLLLYWPSNFGTYALQSTTNLATTNWLTATDTVPATYGSQIAVTVSNITRVRYFRLFNTNPPVIPSGMVLVSAGSFIMGDVTDTNFYGNADPTNVYVSAFYMDTNLVSSNLWQTVYNYATNHGYRFDSAGASQGGNQPVYGMDWFDAIRWCNARSEMEGLAPAYYENTNQTAVFRTNISDVINEGFVKWDANGYRLPTEAEWEKAARGGANGLRFPWGDTISWTNANYYGYPLSIDPSGLDYDLATDENYCPYGSNPSGATPNTTPVGFFPPNNYGLFDMAGNLQEWCWDWYAIPPYPTNSPYLGGSDPHGPASTMNITRVLRGGHWKNVATAARCADREATTPSKVNDTSIGFRCVRGH